MEFDDMKLKVTAMIAAGLLMAGCASTEVKPPQTKLSNTAPYVWDDSKSLALNVTSSAVDIPMDLTDTKVPRGGDITDSGMWKDTAAAVDLLANGLGGLVVGELFRAGGKSSWRPTYILIEPKNGAPMSAKDYRDKFARLFENMLSNYDDLNYESLLFHPKMDSSWGGVELVVAGKLCDDSTSPMTSPIEPFGSIGYFSGPLNINKRACYISMDFNPVRIMTRDNEEFYVYSITQHSFFKGIDEYAKNFDGYLAYPAKAFEITGQYGYGFDFPFVLHQGTMHLFVTP